MSSLLDFIGKRRSELKQLKREINEELRQLKAAEAAARAELGQDIGGSSVKSPKSSERNPTIQEYILAVLSEFPDGLDANKINGEIFSRFSKEYKRASLSPQLSRLKADGKVTLHGKVWAITDAGNSSLLGSHLRKVIDQLKQDPAEAGPERTEGWSDPAVSEGINNDPF